MASPSGGGAIALPPGATVIVDHLRLTCLHDDAASRIPLSGGQRENRNRVAQTADLILE
jgi:hypothetical protein